MKKALHVSCDNARARREHDLLAAKTAHPSYRALDREIRPTREGAHHVERIPGR